jgi:hypothetical protein
VKSVLVEKGVSEMCVGVPVLLFLIAENSSACIIHGNPTPKSANQICVKIVNSLAKSAAEIDTTNVDLNPVFDYIFPEFIERWAYAKHFGVNHSNYEALAIKNWRPRESFPDGGLKENRINRFRAEKSNNTTHIRNASLKQHWSSSREIADEKYRIANASLFPFAKGNVRSILRSNLQNGIVVINLVIRDDGQDRGGGVRFPVIQNYQIWGICFELGIFCRDDVISCQDQPVRRYKKPISAETVYGPDLYDSGLIGLENCGGSCLRIGDDGAQQKEERQVPFHIGPHYVEKLSRKMLQKMSQDGVKRFEMPN